MGAIGPATVAVQDALDITGTDRIVGAILLQVGYLTERIFTLGHILTIITIAVQECAPNGCGLKPVKIHADYGAMA